MGNIGSKRKSITQTGEEVNFDHFVVLRAIGKGSFGKVCIVQKQSTGRLYAMKYMNKAQCEGKSAVDNVLREIEILATLEHPFLVNLWFSFQDEEDMFMVVDLLLGGDLRYHLQQGVVFTDEAVRLFILEVASALDYLHTRNIIHRDIKPDNLLLDVEGHVHLSDFNIATVLQPSQLATSMSGTRPYMAPEVYDCALNLCDGYSFPVDWWSLGVTAYEVRQGKRPFDIHSNTPLEDVRLVFLTAPVFPRDWNSGLVKIISKLLSVSSANRPGSLRALQSIPYGAAISAERILKKEVKPVFTPPKDHLNCDPTFELEEMIIEPKPLHKKKKRLQKQKSIREKQPISRNLQKDDCVFYDQMLVFNREKEELRKKREKREQEWQEELERSMSMSDPTGLGSGFSGYKTSLKAKKSMKDSSEGKEGDLDGVLSTLIAASARSFAASIGPVEGLKSRENFPSHCSTAPKASLEVKNSNETCEGQISTIISSHPHPAFPQDHEGSSTEESTNEKSCPQNENPILMTPVPQNTVSKESRDTPKKHTICKDAFFLGKTEPNSKYEERVPSNQISSSTKEDIPNAEDFETQISRQHQSEHHEELRKDKPFSEMSELENGFMPIHMTTVLPLNEGHCSLQTSLTFSEEESTLQHKSPCSAPLQTCGIVSHISSNPSSFSTTLISKAGSCELNNTPSVCESYTENKESEEERRHSLNDGFKEIPEKLVRRCSSDGVRIDEQITAHEFKIRELERVKSAGEFPLKTEEELQEFLIASCSLTLPFACSLDYLNPSPSKAFPSRKRSSYAKCFSQESKLDPLLTTNSSEGKRAFIVDNFFEKNSFPQCYKMKQGDSFPKNIDMESITKLDLGNNFFKNMKNTKTAVSPRKVYRTSSLTSLTHFEVRKRDRKLYRRSISSDVSKSERL